MERKDIIYELESMAAEVSEDEFCDILERGAQRLKDMEKTKTEDLDKAVSF